MFRGGTLKALHLCDDLKFETVVALCGQYDTGIEVQSFYDPAHLPSHPDSIEKHQRLINSISSRSLHGPFADLCPGSFDIMVRDLARFRFVQAIDIAHQLEVSTIVLHHGYVPGTSLPSSWLKRCTVFWKEIIERTPENMVICLENLFEQGPELLSDLIDSVGESRLRVCLDIGHVHCKTKVPATQWIEYLKDKIAYVHLHDNHGEKDEHLGLGEGTLPIDETCHALEEFAPEAIWALETQVESMPASIDWLVKHGFTQKVAS